MSRPADGRALTTSLARLGFARPDLAAQRLQRIGLHPDDPLVAEVAGVADPDLAAAALDRLLSDGPNGQWLRQQLAADGGLRTRLLAVLGASAALGEHLSRHPDQCVVLAGDELSSARLSRLGLRTELLGAVAGMVGRDARDALRVAYRRRLLTVAARDLSGALAVDDVAGELADLAEATLAAALDIARREHDAATRIAVIGMGKCGGRELNYVSDVDVIFVAEPADSVAAAVAAALMRICSDVTAEGAIWPVDASLRPEGKAGPLVRTVASHEGYYRRWAKTWEFQALLKARPVAGDEELAAAYLDTITPLVWTAADRADFVTDVQAMRRRVLEHVRPADADREVKLGPGGLRDVEFAVQLLQLVHGRTDATLRSPTTLPALDALRQGGYVGRDDAARLADAYRFLRTVEHRLQLYQLRRTHLLPSAEADLRRLARAMGCRDLESWRREYGQHTREVRRLHEKLFYRPLLAAVARLPADEARLTPGAAEQRLEALGFADPAAALRHLEALTRGVSRRAAIQRTLLPVMLGWFADAADPDAGLLAFRQVSEALGTTPWYLRVLRDEGATAERLARLLATSRYIADLLGRAPEAVAMLGQDAELVARRADALRTELVSSAARSEDWENAVAVVRGMRRRELLRTAVADLLGTADCGQVGRALTDVTAATLEAALATAVRKVEAERRGALPVAIAIIGMGRLGGGEQGYGSDADVLFCYQPRNGEDDTPAHTQVAHDVAQELRRLLARPAPDPPLVVDADLRPEGRQGPLVRSLSSYAEYYRRWSSVWESQALLRARPIAGDAELGELFVRLVEPIRYPPDGLPAASVREIRRLKARMEAERLPRGADAHRHLKLGRGGLSDVEWTVQLFQLRHAAAVESLRTTSTVDALDAARHHGLVDEDDAATLVEAWLLVTTVRNAIVLARGRPAELIPSDPRSLEAVARAMRYPAGGSQQLLEDYRRVTRRARSVYERLFFE